MIEIMKKVFYLTVTALLALIALATFVSDAVAGDTLRPRYGITASYLNAFHTADFHQLKAVKNCCPTFESGSGSGYLAGLLYETPFFKRKDSRLLFSLNVLYSSHDGELNDDEETSVMLGGSLEDVTIRHELTSRFQSLNIEPLVNFFIWKNLYFKAGYSAFFLFTKEYDQLERLIEPEDRTFDDGRTIRHEVSGDLEDASFINSSVIGGIGYDLALGADGEIIIAPEVKYRLSLTPVIEGTTWNIDGLSAGISIKWSPKYRPPEIEDEFREKRIIDTIRIDREGLAERYTSIGRPSISNDTVLIDYTRIITETIIRTDTVYMPLMPEPEPEPVISGFDSVAIDFELIKDGNPLETNTLTLEEFRSTNMQPLLCYIFFDHNSAIIPKRYKRLEPQQTNAFTVESLVDSPTLPTYYNVLNIIGRRMRDNPGMTITITGCNSGFGEEESNTELSKQRANSVYDYLKSIWEIGMNRMEVKFRNTPEVVSNPKISEGQEENRRVEIESRFDEITSPVILDDTLRLANAGQVVLMPKIYPPDKTKKWTIFLEQGGSPVGKFEGEGAPQERLLWFPNDEDVFRGSDSKEIKVHLEASGTAGDTAAVAENILVNYMTLDKKQKTAESDIKVDRYSLFLFDFDDPDLKQRHKKTIDFIKKRLEADSRIKVYGFSDNIGDDRHNRILSEKRASNVVRALGRVAGAKIEYEGLGESRLLFDNSLPEGRFYCRTVRVMVETPLD